METHSKKTIVVPWDFSERSEAAVQHAILLAQVVGDNIVLVHFARRLGRFAGGKARGAHLAEMARVQSALEGEAQRLQLLCDRRMRGEAPSDLNEPFSIQRELHPIAITARVLECKQPQEAMQRMAVDTEFNLIVSAQYYPSGKPKEWDLVQHFKRVKLETRGIIPFIIVNTAPRHAHYSQLVVPMDHDNTYKEKLQWVMHLSHYYHCNINFIKAFYRVERKKKGISNNLYFTKKILEAQDIVYGIKNASRHHEFSQEVFNFSQSIDADLLIVNTDKLEVFFPTGQVNVNLAVMFINSMTKRYQAFY